MKPKIMNELTTSDREDLIMKAIIKTLNDLGGIA